MKNRKLISHFFALVLLICLFSTGFRISAGETPAIDTSLHYTSQNIAINETYKLNTLLYYPKESATYTFIADDPSVVSISTENVATGLKAGETILSLEETYQGKTKIVDTITFIVKDANFSITAKEPQLAVNEQDTLKIAYENIKASYKMTSSNPSIVYLDSKKSITGKKAGTAYITLTETYQNKSRVVAKLKVTVLNPILRKSKKTIAIKEQLQPIEQELLYMNKKASYKMYTSDKTIVSLTSNKVATGEKAGTATITIKETYQNKTRTVASFKVIVSKAVIKTDDDASMIIYMDEKKPFSADSYVSYRNKLATYTAEVKNPSICKIEKDNILALKEGSTSLLITETYLKKSRKVGEIKVTVNTKPELIQLDYMNKKPSAGAYFTILKGVSGNLNTLLNVTPKQLNLQFISSNEEVFSIDKNTGIFQGKTAGEAVITISGKTTSLNIAVTVISGNELPQLSEESEKQVAAINSLHADNITQDNLMDSYNALIEVYNIIGKEFDESDLYYLKGNEQFWMIPNINNMENYKVALDKQLLLYAQNMNKKRKISKVNLLNTKTLEIELNTPFTKEEFAYNHLNDFDYYVLDAIQQFEIYDSKGIVLVDSGSTNYSSGDKNIKINLKKALPDGTYIIKIPSFVLDSDFNYISLDFKFIKKGNSIK